MKLEDLGERRILSEIIPRYVAAAGDDCCILPIGGYDIISTTDPAPIPAAWALTHPESDPYWLGWLAVTINMSDLAAAGAEPQGFLAAIEAPSDFLVSSFERLLQGIKDSCNTQGITYAGGNIKEGKSLSVVGTAIGSLLSGQAYRRIGCQPGDLLFSVGEGGRFWADFLLEKWQLMKLDRRSSPVFSPRSQIEAMRQTSLKGIISAAMDNSDGLLSTLKELARVNGLSVRLDLDRLTPSAGCKQLGVDGANLWLGWGDWNVIVAVHPDQAATFREVVHSAHSKAIYIGACEAGSDKVYLSRGDRSIEAPRLESERFAHDSWFSAGLDSYIDTMQSIQLP